MGEEIKKNIRTADEQSFDSSLELKDAWDSILCIFNWVHQSLKNIRNKFCVIRVSCLCVSIYFQM